MPLLANVLEMFLLYGGMAFKFPGNVAHLWEFIFLIISGDLWMNAGFQSSPVAPVIVLNRTDLYFLFSQPHVEIHIFVYIHKCNHLSFLLWWDFKFVVLNHDLPPMMDASNSIFQMKKK